MLVGLEKGIAVHIREGGRELEHFVLGKVQGIPELLKFATGILHEQVKVLPLELVQSGEFIVEFVDLSDAAAAVGIQERLTLPLVDTELFPEGLDGIFQITQALLPGLLLALELVSSGAQARNVLLM